MSDFYNKYPYTDFHELNLDWIIERVKQLTEDWIETKQAWENTEAEWEELYNYVHDYFDNLDVQTEINNKINAMIADGTFVTITTPVIEAKVASMMPSVVAGQIDNVVASQIDGVVANQIVPVVAEQLRGSYGSPLVANTVANMTNHSRVYVYTGNEAGYTSGHWYYWNNNQWNDGGVYNAVAITVDNALDPDSINPVQNKIITDKVDNIDKSFDSTLNYLFSNIVYHDVVSVNRFVTDNANPAVSIGGTHAGTKIPVGSDKHAIVYMDITPTTTPASFSSLYYRVVQYDSSDQSLGSTNYNNKTTSVIHFDDDAASFAIFPYFGKDATAIAYYEDFKIFYFCSMGVNTLNNEVVRTSLYGNRTLFKQGSINTTTGADTNATTAIKTDFIDARLIDTVSCSEDYTFTVIQYAGIGLAPLSRSTFSSQPYNLQQHLEATCKYVRILLVNFDSSKTVTPDEQTYISIVGNIPDMTFLDDQHKIYGIDTVLGYGMEFGAHRGARAYAPENSIPAYTLAGEIGFQWLWLAVCRQSADGTWYIMHDATVDRTTNGTGYIADLTDSQISELYIDTGEHVEDYTHEELHIPTLVEAIQICKQYGMKIAFRLGSLPESYTAGGPWDSFISIIKKYRCENMIFSGASMAQISIIKKLGLDWHVQYDVYSTADGDTQIDNYIAAGIKNASLFIQYNMLTDALISKARNNGYKIMIFSSSSITLERAKEYCDLGVDVFQNPNLASVFHYPVIPES